MGEVFHYILLGLILKGSVTAPVNGDAGPLIGHFKNYNSRAEVWRLLNPEPMRDGEGLGERIAELQQNLLHVAVRLEPTDKIVDHFSLPLQQGVTHILVDLHPAGESHRPATPRKGNETSIPTSPDQIVGKEAEMALDRVINKPSIPQWIEKLDGQLRLWETGCELKIPTLGDGPCLLLHDLGGLASTSPVTELFNKMSTTKLFINASGSGKTRILLEGLCANWGFYFVCAKSAASSIGSRDLIHALGDLKCRKGFDAEAGTIPQCNTNETIAEKALLCVFAARMYLFRSFLEHGLKKGIDHATLRKRWVIAQVVPGNDEFDKLARDLRPFSTDFVRSWLCLSAAAVQEMIGDNTQSYIVIDESQGAADLYQGAFQSHSLLGARRPSLTMVLRCTCFVQENFSNGHTATILSGTGIHYDDLKAIAESNIAKATGLEFVTVTGSFGRDEQRSYICKYLFPDGRLLRSQEEFLGRAWQWLRGRFRFIARFIEIVLLSKQKPPDYDRLLDAYFLAMTGTSPYDSKPPQIDLGVVLLSPILTEKSKELLMQNPKLFDEVCVTIFRFVTRSEYIPVERPTSVDGTQVDLVELGFARFLPGAGSDYKTAPCYIQEPIAITAILNFCKEKKPFDVWLANRWKSSKCHGVVFEDIVIHRLYQALAQDGGCSLNSILEFKGTVPKWASSRAKLIALHQVGNDIQSIPVTSCPLPYACSPQTWEETVIWFQGRTDMAIPICAPDQFMGPDLLCFVELSKTTRRKAQRILLGVQISSGQKSTKKAARTVDPDLFWMKHRDSEPAPHDNAISCANDLIDTLLKNLGIDLRGQDHYVGILASQDAKTLPADFSTASGNQHLAVLKIGTIQGTIQGTALSLAKCTFRTPFEGSRELAETLRKEGKRKVATEQKRVRGGSAGGRKTKRSKLSPDEMVTKGPNKSSAGRRGE